jgi:hypothetical protein
MNPLFSVAVFLLVLTPAWAQQVGQSVPEPGQQTSVAAQPDTTKSGLSQAAALAAAQDAAQDAEESAAQEAEDQSQSQPSNTDRYFGAQPVAETHDQPGGQPLPERRILQVVAAAAVTPRSEASAYPVHREQGQFSVGAMLLSAKEVEQKFSAPLGKRYLVVEVGVFPVGEVTVRQQDFTIRTGNEAQTFFAATPEDVATDLANHPRRVGIFPTLGVGYSNGPWGRGVSTGVGVGIAGGPRPYSRGPMGANRRVIENELRDKSLPAGSLTKPVAGYLYFPVKEKHDAHYSLELTRNGQVLSLPLPDPKK